MGGSPTNVAVSGKRESDGSSGPLRLSPNADTLRSASLIFKGLVGAAPSTCSSARKSQKRTPWRSLRDLAWSSPTSTIGRRRCAMPRPRSTRVLAGRPGGAGGEQLQPGAGAGAGSLRARADEGRRRFADPSGGERTIPESSSGHRGGIRTVPDNRPNCLAHVTPALRRAEYGVNVTRRVPTGWTGLRRRACR